MEQRLTTADSSPVVATLAPKQDELPWHLGVSGYRHVQELLAAEISPEEATDAERVFRRSRRQFAAWLAALVLLHFVRLWLLSKGTVAWEISYDLLTASVLLSFVYFASRWRMPLAGRILLPLQASFWSPARSLYEFELVNRSYSAEIEYATLLLVAIGSGFLLDVGALNSHRTTRRNEVAGRLSLSFGAAAALLMALVGWVLESGNYPPVMTVLVALSLIVWPWTDWKPFQGRWSPLPRDVVRLLDSAQLRWGRVLAGRSLAILLALVPLLLFLTSLGLSERMRWPGAGEAVITQRIGDYKTGVREEVAWYWTSRGEYLSAADFERFVIYRFSRFASNDGAQHPADALQPQAVTGPETDRTYERWQAMVDERRIRTADEFVAFTEANPLNSLRYLQKLPSAGGDAAPAGATAARVRELELTPYSRQRVETLGTIVNRNIAPFVVFASLGFFVLWRRGGDSSTAWWLGIWLLASTGWYNSGLLRFYYQSLRHDLLEGTIAGGNLADWALLTFLALSAVYVVAYVLYMLGVPQAGVWVHLCWPTNATTGRLNTWTINGAKIGLVSAAYGLLFIAAIIFVLVSVYLVGELFVDMDQVDDSPIEVPLMIGGGGTLAFLGLLAIGWILRRRTSRLSDAPYLTWRPVAAIIFAHLSLVLFYPSGTLALYSQYDLAWQTGTAPLICWWLGVGCLVAFVVMASWTLLRDNFLRLAAVRDYTTLIVVFLLPITFESLEQLAGNNLAAAGSVLHSEQGIAVISVLLTIAVLVPLWSLLQRMFVLLSAPQLRLFERSAIEALEQMVVEPDGDDQLAAVKRFFEQTDVKQYVLYARQGADTFRKLHQQLDWRTDERLKVSCHLREFLSDRPRFIDLYDAPFEWNYFFQQFELHRLQQAVHCRYLLPICLGTSLRGLLLLPDDEQAAKVTREAIAENVSRVGLEAVRR